MNANARCARSLFLKAVEERRPDEWDAYLDENCGSNLALRERVEVLLHAHGAENRLLDAPAVPMASADQRKERKGCSSGCRLRKQDSEPFLGEMMIVRQYLRNAQSAQGEHRAAVGQAVVL